MRVFYIHGSFQAEKNRPPEPTVYYMLVFICLLQHLEEGKCVQSDYKDNENRCENLCPTRKKRVDGTSLILGEVRISSTCNNTDALLVAFLKNDYNDDRDGYDREHDSEHNTYNVHIIVLS